MCDCCTLDCDGCGEPISVHIGDFSVARENVRVYCHQPGCRDKALRKLLGTRDVKQDDGSLKTEEFGGMYMVFSDGFVNEHAYDGAGPGKAVLFLVDMPRGISTN